MQDTARHPIALRYRKGLNLWLPLALLLGSAVLFGGLIVWMFQILPAGDRHVAWLLSAVLLAGLVVAAAVTLPPIRRFVGATPAVVVSTEGIRTRDMGAFMPWNKIERLSVRQVVSYAGPYWSATTALDLHPTDGSTGGGSWLWLVDGNANALRVPLRALEQPELLAEALARHAPPDLLSRSDLTELPGSQRLSRLSG